MTATLTRVMPVYHFSERHSRFIAAGPDAVWRALAGLTLSSLRITRPLVAIRGLGRKETPAKPLFTDGPVTMLEISAPSYAVGGAIGRPWQVRPTRIPVTSLAEFVDFAEPGWVKYLTDFEVRPVEGGSRLSTETRGYSTDAGSRRRFALYWALIRPWSGLVRRDILAAVARSADVERPL